MHEHVFVLAAGGARRTTATSGARATGTRRCASPTRSRSCDAVSAAGIQTIVDPTVLGPRPLHPAHPADQRRGRPQHRRRDRRLRLPRAAELPRATAAPTRSPSSSSARSARASTTPASRRRSSSAPSSSHGLIGDVPRILAAIAAAAIETGAPVMVHTNAAAQTGLPALEALTDAGVDPTRIVIAHAGDSNDLDYLRAIADTGASARLRPLQHRALQPGREARSRRSPRSSRRATATASISATTRRASTTSWSATRSSPTRSRTTSTSRRTIVPALLAGGRHAGSRSTRCRSPTRAASSRAPAA